MALKGQVEDILQRIPVPGISRSLGDMNLIRDVEIKEDNMKVVLAEGAVMPEDRDSLRNDLQDKLRGLNGVKRVAVEFEEVPFAEINRIDKAIAVMSGKGGVGKSLVTGLLAVALAREAKSVGILDADITGPSIPKMFGLNGRPMGTSQGLMPRVSKLGIEIMSMNLLLSREDDAVIWRGPIISKCIHQFWEDVHWGTLGYLLVDMPPGTADVPLTVMQALPLHGVVIVTTPQELTSMIVRKAIHMSEHMKVPVLGVVENMSYFQVPGTGDRFNIFGPSKVEELASAVGSPVLARIPVDPKLALACDEGRIEGYEADFLGEFCRSFLGLL